VELEAIRTRPMAKNKNPRTMRTLRDKARLREAFVISKLLAIQLLTVTGFSFKYDIPGENVSMNGKNADLYRRKLD
jgi:hypothetical protein